MGTCTQGVVGSIVSETQQRHLSLVNSSRSKGVVERNKLIFKSSQQKLFWLPKHWKKVWWQDIKWKIQVSLKLDVHVKLLSCGALERFPGWMEQGWVRLMLDWRAFHWHTRLPSLPHYTQLFFILGRRWGADSYPSESVRQYVSTCPVSEYS